MRFQTLIPLAVVAVLPFAQAILILESAAATTGTLTLTAGSGAVAAAGAAAVAVAGGLLLAGLVASAANRRGKRETGTQPCLPSNNPDLFLTLAANSDTFGCGMRLVCELEATPDEALSQDEMIILSLFGRQVKPATFSQLNTAKSGFQYAALVGSQAKNVSECAEVFDKCPFDRVTMMQAFNQAAK